MRRGSEQCGDIFSRQRNGLGGDEGCEQPVEAQIAEILPAKQGCERLRNLRLDFVGAVEQKQALFAVRENGLGQPVAGTE